MASEDAPTKTISDFEATLTKADTVVASFEKDDKTLVHKLRNFLRRNPTMIPALVLILSILVFGLIQPRFLGVGALSTVLKQVTVTGFIALAQTLIILTAGIDLSVGAILVVSSLVMANLAVFSGVPVIIAVLIGIALGGVMGAVNGLLVTLMRLPPFIVTLGTLSVFESLKLWYSQSESVRNVDIEANAPSLLFFGQGFNISGASVSYGGITLILLAALLWYVLNHTAWGRHVHAIGDDPDAALLSGINVNRTLVSVYTVAGLICGFAAWIAIGRVGSVSPIAFQDVNLASITAVVIGGTSLFGGRGSIIGSVLGAMIVGVFITGLSLAGVDDYWQKFAAGCLVIIAVALDQWLRRASQ
ncbi:ABC transporter permease [Tabrizicola sp.]|jgi:fructose transport system permease protein|uniref:ABC transporter permease n=1 Tax=Tabrizicola sp. TaxID=2005166 RepID=UPI0025DD14A1|nr:ABC transporter permease [Tabrizicola sp.]MBY0351927.1 ABC transporter permease [Tabrizicola sp.]